MVPRILLLFLFLLVFLSNSLSTKTCKANLVAKPLTMQSYLKSLLIRGGATKLAKKKLKKSFINTIVDKLRSIISKFYPTSTRSNDTKKNASKATAKGKNVANGNNIVGNSNNRLKIEMKSFLESPPVNCQLIVDSKNIRSWTVLFTGLDGTIYAGEKFKLKMVFPKDYPSKRKHFT